MELAREEKCEFLPFMAPKQVRSPHCRCVLPPVAVACPAAIPIISLHHITSLLCLCSQIHVNKAGHICAMEFARNVQELNGEWHVDDEQLVHLKCDFVISAFGCQLRDSDGMPGALVDVLYITWLW